MRCADEPGLGCRARLVRRMKDRETGCARSGEQLRRRRQGIPCVDTARGRKLLCYLVDGLGATLIGELIQVDRKQRGLWTDIEIATVVAIKFVNVGWNDVLPTMVFERITHIVSSSVSTATHSTHNLRSAYIHAEAGRCTPASGSRTLRIAG